ncbi:hypothetical protein KF728_19645 [Candidatus Obscuribacterales bacterium]|nr:hypothetical protein [Candidatus Obscuribacterales bacterium]
MDPEPHKHSVDDLPVLAPALRIINQLETEGIIKKPTIGGSIALGFHGQMLLTDDLDVFCYFEGQGLIQTTAPILERLNELGYATTELGASIEGVEVHLGQGHGIVTEALEHALQIEVEGVPFHVFDFEYALAVKAEAGRSKDWLHIASTLEAAEPDEKKLFAILEKHGLLKAWKRKLDDE